MTTDKLPVSYVLYSHYSDKEGADFSAFQTAKGRHLEDDRLNQQMRASQGIQSLKRYFRGLKELLETPGHEGILLLFYASGFEDLLDNLRKTKDVAETKGLWACLVRWRSCSRWPGGTAHGAKTAGSLREPRPLAASFASRGRRGPVRRWADWTAGHGRRSGCGVPRLRPCPGALGSAGAGRGFASTVALGRAPWPAPR